MAELEPIPNPYELAGDCSSAATIPISDEGVYASATDNFEPEQPTKQDSCPIERLLKRTMLVIIVAVALITAVVALAIAIWGITLLLGDKDSNRMQVNLPATSQNSTEFELSHDDIKTKLLEMERGLTEYVDRAQQEFTKAENARSALNRSIANESKFSRNFSESMKSEFRRKIETLLLIDDWHTSKDYIYKVFNERKAYGDAENTCQKFGGRLGAAVLRDSDAVSNIISKKLYQSRFYIGYNDRESEGNWTWADNDDTNSSLLKWGDREPSNGEGEDCVDVFDASETIILMEDGKCDTAEAYMCEVKMEFDG